MPRRTTASAILSFDGPKSSSSGCDSAAAEEPFAEYFAGWKRPWNYAPAEETEARLKRASFEHVRCWLEPRNVTPADPRAFVQTVCLVRHLDPLPEQLRDDFVDRVL